MPRRVVVVGGGTQDRLWPQVVSDITGFAQEVPGGNVGAVLGDAYLAGYAAGIFSDSGPLKTQWVPIARTVEPNMAVKPLYDNLYAIYRRLYEKTRDEMHLLSRLQQ